MSVVARKSRHGIVLSAEEPSELEHRVACYTLPHKVVQRAKIVLYAAEGLSNAEIARRLGVSPHTVERHVANIYRKIDARGRADATAYALRRRLV